MGDDNIVSLEPKLQARAEAAAGRRVGVDLSAERFRMIARRPPNARTRLQHKRNRLRFAAYRG